MLTRSDRSSVLVVSDDDSLEPMSSPRPNFFLVGAPKSGTTSMDAYLGRHPEIHMAAEKESHHFATDFLFPQHPLRSLREYLRLFRGAPVDARRIGESSVYYLMSETAAREIHEFDRDAKILIHLRNPVDLVYSHHFQLLFEGYQDLECFEEALERGDDGRLAELDRLVLSRVALARDYFRVVDFPRQIRRYQELFPPENLHYVLLDDLRRDPAATFERVLAFLGVDPSFRVSFDVMNPNKRVRSARLRSMLRNPPSWLSIPSRLLFPLGMRNQIKKTVKRANTNFEARESMRPETRRALEERFAPIVRETAELIGRDLSSWLPSGEAA